MTTAAIVLAAVLAAALVAWVARPFLRPERPGGDAEPGPGELERAQLLDERDRALAALKELEFDHRTGKISDADYARMLPALRHEAAAALAALDEHAGRARADVPAPDAAVPPAEVPAREERPR